MWSILSFVQQCKVQFIVIVLVGVVTVHEREAERGRRGVTVQKPHSLRIQTVGQSGCSGPYGPVPST